MNRDVVKLIASYMDEDTLREMSKYSSLREKIAPVIDPYFWYLKAQHLVNFDLEWEKNKTETSLRGSIENWHQVYNILSDIDKGIDPFSSQGALTREENGYNLLAVKTLLRLRYDPSKSDLASILSAVAFGSPEVVQLLLRYMNRDQKHSAFIYSGESGRLDVMKILLVDSDIARDDVAIYEALIGAASSGELEIVELLLPRVTDLEALQVAIETSARRGYTSILSLLLKNKRVDIDKYLYLLSEAIEEDRVDVVRVLLGGTTDISLRKISDRIFNDAIQYGSSLVVKLLLRDKRFRLDGDQALFWAVNARQSSVVALLLQDSRVDPSSATGDICITIAVDNNDVKTVELLLADGRADRSGSIVASRLNWLDKNSDQMINALVRGRNTDLSTLPSHTLEYVVDHTREYTRDASKGSAMLSPNLINLKGTYISYNTYHYDMLLREIILKRLDLEYYLEWILKQLRKKTTNRKIRRAFSEVARDLLRGRAVHTSVFYTAYRGFFLLSVSSDAQVIMNTLESEEGVTKEGLRLAGALIGAFLGEQKMKSL